MWRLGRKLYACARGDYVNDPRVNGEYWLLGKVVRASGGPHVLLDVGANKGDWTARALGTACPAQRLSVHAFGERAGEQAELPQTKALRRGDLADAPQKNG